MTAAKAIAKILKLTDAGAVNDVEGLGQAPRRFSNLLKIITPPHMGRAFLPLTQDKECLCGLFEVRS